jgi:hypothetical protein
MSNTPEFGSDAPWEIHYSGRLYESLWGPCQCSECRAKATKIEGGE